MTAGKPLKPTLSKKGSISGGVKKNKGAIVFGSDVQDYVLDMQRSEAFQTPNHGDLVETRAHNYQIKVEAKKFEVEQLQVR